jgi:hypothetical protein
MFDMSQTKKSTYDMYTTMLAKTEKVIRSKMVPKVNTKHQLGHALRENPWMRQTLEFSIYLEEYLWERDGRQVIFPESAAVVDNLMRASFDLDSCDGFSLPFRSMVVAMPAGYVHNGLKIPSFLATFARNNTPDEKLHPFLDAVKESHSDYRIDGNASERVLVIQYRDNTDSWAKVSIVDTDLPRILKCKDAATFSKELGMYKGIKRGFSEYTDQDREIHFFALKLVASMGVYCLATGGKRLLDGFPGATMPKLMGHDGSTGMRLSTLQSVVRTKESPEAHYRAWHFRQLRDDRFYRGEHAHAPKGSRYVFVSDAMIGQKVDPSTMV